ncbi:hypothetical protein ACFSCX_02895 [Bacillus salitolerans]|uniref:HTH merR-type domain-containing protein n=1 Tax=Bacillus salitolerans TaxID=1437434 RepID=A0ABW4LK81_9BACI
MNHHAIEKKWHSTTEVAHWLGVTDSQLRYYLKPFYEYVTSEDAPSSSSAYRLDALAVIKLKMILLLKDQYRVSGLEKLLGLDGAGYVHTKSEKKPAVAKIEKDRDQLEQQVFAITPVNKHFTVKTTLNVE